MKRNSTLKTHTGFKPRKSPLRATGGLKRGKKAKKRKPSIWTLYGLQKPKYVRYGGRKGVYWYLLSEYVRRRDFGRYGGECIDQCGGKASSWQEFQGGHFVPTSCCGFGLLLDEMNVHGQLPACNNPRISPMASIGFARGLDKRYGPGTADELMRRKGEITKEWTQKEYHERILILKEKLAALTTN